MAYGYLKEPVEQHKDIKLAVSVLFCKDGKAIVHSRLSDKTFEIDASNIYFKAEPNLEYREYVTNPPEEKIKLGEEPLYPIFNSEGMPSYYKGEPNFGISKRLYIATAALQGILTNSDNVMSIPNIIECSFRYADEMLAQEYKE